METIANQIITWMESPANNSIEPGSDLPAFDRPLVGIASGADRLFTFLKQDIGSDFYWTPREAFSQAFPNERVQPKELSIIAWVLPQTRETKKAHSKCERLPSIEWSKSRYYGEQVNDNLRRFVVDSFSSQNISACAPVLLPDWSQAESGKYGFASKWSERHTAHVCGLGTFGLSDGLITPVGKAVRVGSAIVRTFLQPTERHYEHHNEWCLNHHEGMECGACIERCPVDAISDKGHDKIKCKQYTRTITAPYVEQEQLGFKVFSCGLCQTKIPCENQIPAALKKKGLV